MSNLPRSLRLSFGLPFPHGLLGAQCKRSDSGDPFPESSGNELCMRKPEPGHKIHLAAGWEDNHAPKQVWAVDITYIPSALPRLFSPVLD